MRRRGLEDGTEYEISPEHKDIGGARTDALIDDVAGKCPEPRTPGTVQDSSAVGLAAGLLSLLREGRSADALEVLRVLQGVLRAGVAPPTTMATVTPIRVGSAR